MKLTTCYTSSNSNQVPTVVDWGKNDLICYGSCNSVFIYDSNVSIYSLQCTIYINQKLFRLQYGSGGKVTHVLIKHTKRVNSVKWLTGKDIINEKELISGSTDGDVCVWTLVDDKYESVILKSHTLNVNIVDGLYKGENCSSAVIVSISMDRTAKIWFRQNLTGMYKYKINHSLVTYRFVSFFSTTKVN